MTIQEYINEHPEKFVDDIDKWLFTEFSIAGGCCSAQGSMEYSVARMVAEKMKQQLIDYGKGWVERDTFSVEVIEDNGKYVAGIYYGERYTETDPYKRRDHALCEAKGFLEGIKIQIDGCLEYIDKELEKEDSYENT